MKAKVLAIFLYLLAIASSGGIEFVRYHVDPGQILSAQDAFWGGIMLALKVMGVILAAMAIIGFFIAIPVWLKKDTDAAIAKLTNRELGILIIFLSIAGGGVLAYFWLVTPALITSFFAMVVLIIVASVVLAYF